MLMQSFIIKFNLLSLFHSLSIIFPFSKEAFILFGNFSMSLINSSLKYLLLYIFSVSINN